MGVNAEKWHSWEPFVGRFPVCQRGADLEDLLRVAGGMGSDHEEGFVAGDGAGDEGMIGDPALKVVGGLFDVAHDVGTCGVEGRESLGQRRKAAVRMDSERSLNGAGAVDGEGGDFGSAPGFLEGFRRELCGVKAGEQVSLRLHHVFQALKDGPASRGWLVMGERFVEPGEGVSESFAAIVQGAQQQLFFGTGHRDLLRETRRVRCVMVREHAGLIRLL